MKKLNLAIAGSGYSARLFHVPFFKIDPRFNIKKFFERSTERSKEWVADAEIVRDYARLLTPDIDLVVITTPNQTHYDMVKAALLAGKHVLVEKPLVATSSEAIELANLAKERNVVLYVYQNRRWDSHILAAQQILAQGLLGEPIDCEIRIDRFAKTKNPKVWKETGDAGTGLVYDLGVHLIDQAVYLFGRPQAVFADIRYQHEGTLVDDNFDIHLYYASGLKVSAMASKYAREPAPAFSLHGKRGSYVKQDVDIQEAQLAKGVVPTGDWYRETEELWGVLHTEIEGEIVRKPYPNVKVSYQGLIDNLYDSVVNGATPIVTAEQAAFVLHIIEKAFDSARQGKKVEL